MNHHRATALLAAASLLALAGCGSSSSTATKPTTPATSATSSSTAPATTAPAPTSGAAPSATGPAPSASAPAVVPVEPDAKTTITVDCEPAKTQKQLRADWEADVKTFEAAHPLITIKSVDTDPCVNPATFNAKLKAGQV
ncbi:MAG: multiple sugar transport system substrate-binding protein, partial [Frankiales bacterium]|nr:multiple sugar transport system substrate-binding protein [Frankiales bacterium]